MTLFWYYKANCKLAFTFELVMFSNELKYFLFALSDLLWLLLSISSVLVSHVLRKIESPNHNLTCDFILHNCIKRIRREFENGECIIETLRPPLSLVPWLESLQIRLRNCDIGVLYELLFGITQCMLFRSIKFKISRFMKIYIYELLISSRIECHKVLIAMFIFGYRVILMAGYFWLIVVFWIRGESWS